MRKLIFLFLFVMLGASLVEGALYRTYQTEDGLSHNGVWAVMQDSRGYMWFGTNDGLNRFDGLTFTVYRRSDSDTLSLGNNFIHCLRETRNGHILVGTKEGLYSYDPLTDRFRHIRLAGKPAAEDRTSVHCIEQDEAGNIWVGCYGQGVYRLSADEKIEKHYAGRNLPSLYITALTLDGAGNPWIGTDSKGFFRLDPASGKAVGVNLDGATIQSLCRHNNSLWIGTSSHGLYRFDPMKNALTHVPMVNSSAPVRDIKAITSVKPGEIVMGSENGLLHLSCNDASLTPYDNPGNFDNLPDKSIFSIAADREGALWLGTYFHGVSYWSPVINAFSFFPAFGNHNANYMMYGLNSQAISNNVQAVLPVGPQLWVSDYDRGIAVMSGPGGLVTRNFTVADGLPSNVVATLFESSKGEIYAGTTHGAAVYDGVRFNPVQGLNGASVMSILEDFDGNIWFATHFYGLFKKTPDGKLVNYKNRPGDSASLPGNNLNTILLDSGGKIWVGTEGEGLAILNPANGKVEKRLSEGVELPSSTIYSIREDDSNNMWIATGGGLIKINKDNFAVQNFRYLENLLKINYTHNSSLKNDSDGTLCFGGTGGYILFDPSAISTNTAAPPVHITLYTIDGQRRDDSAASPEKIEMKSSESTLGIDVACLSYLSPGQNVVAYRLDGYDDDWKYLSGTERHIEYMNLPWGTYKLEIKGANNDGVWSQPITTEVKVNRPVLMSNMMLVVYLLILVFIGYVVKTRISAAQRRKMVKFSHAKEKELYEAKIGFFTNIAHEIRTPLSLISAPLESILSSGDGNPKTRHNLEVMQMNVGRLLELINQLLDFRKVEAQLMRLNFRRCDVSQIVTDICSRYDDFANLHRIKLDTAEVQKGVTCTLDREAFEKITGNLMSNAMKYADKHIRISLRLDESAGKLILRVIDDGPGIKEKDMEKIFESFYRVDDHGKHPSSGLGLPLARSLAQMHSGSLTVESVYGNGSTFVLEIPTNLQEGDEPLQPETDDAAVEARQIEEQEESKPQKPAVLVVEDNEQLRELIAENLSDIYTVYMASNGVEGLKQLEKHMIDLVVSDIMMPDMDGIELCRMVRTSPEFSHIPIVILSAKTDVDTKVEGLNIGADAYVEKPFSIEHLRAQIRSIFDNRNRLRKSLISSPLDYYKNYAPDDDDKESEKAEFINKLNDLILENLTNPEFSIDSLAQEFYMSRSSFHKRIKGITGETPNDYIRIVRLSKSAELLASRKYQIVEVCYMVGFNTPSYFSKCFAKHFGKLPKDYINELTNNNNNNNNNNN